MSEPEETSSSYHVICPYCRKPQRDSWELGDGGEGCGEMECGHCEKSFLWSREVQVTYAGKPINA